MSVVHVDAGVGGHEVKAELAANGSLLPAWGGARRGKRAAQDLGALAVCPSSMLSLSVLNISSTSCKRQHSPSCSISSAGLCLLAIRNNDEQNVDRVITWHCRCGVGCWRHSSRGVCSSSEGPQESDEAALCRAIPRACCRAGSAWLSQHHQAPKRPHEHPARPGERLVPLTRCPLFTCGTALLLAYNLHQNAMAGTPELAVSLIREVAAVLKELSMSGSTVHLDVCLECE